MTTDPFEETKSNLNHPLIRKRREAINRLGELLQDPNYRDEALQLLKDRSANDLYGNMRELAQMILKKDEKKHAGPSLVEGGEHVFGVECTNPKCRHVNYYDKREVCDKFSKFHRFFGQKRENGLDELLLPCEQCGTENKVNVNCEGYR